MMYGNIFRTISENNRGRFFKDMKIYIDPTMDKKELYKSITKNDPGIKGMLADLDNNALKTIITDSVVDNLGITIKTDEIKNQGGGIRKTKRKTIKRKKSKKRRTKHKKRKKKRTKKRRTKRGHRGKSLKRKRKRR